MIHAVPIELIVIGGSAGSLPIIFQLLKSLPESFDIPVVIIIHRQKNSDSGMPDIFKSATKHPHIYEPEDKEPVKRGCIYIAPQNYHLLLEDDHTFSLDYSETVLHSRPSIDVTFESAAKIYRQHLSGIILSGANSDGTAGLQRISENGGVCIAQQPATAQYPPMPQSAMENVPGIQAMEPGNIAVFLKELNG